MKAVGYQQCLAVTEDACLQDINLPSPVASGHDLLVRVKAVSVNPVDTKVRRTLQPEQERWQVLGYDAAGLVEAVGPQVTLFKPGDAVWYAGAINRPGTNAEYHLVDERIVGYKPRCLDYAAAAALPLTAITAWELLFERLGVAQGQRPRGEQLLIVGAAGGVGSILIQLARQLTGLTVIATAGRAESAAWIRKLGAHHVLDHRQPLAPQLHALGIGEVSDVASLTHTDHYFAQLAELLRPQGKLALIDDPDAQALDIRLLKRKSISLHWEFMFTRPLYQTPDLLNQHRLLNDVAELVDGGLLRSTARVNLGTINATNLRRAHAMLEGGTTLGKIVLSGF